MRKILQEQCSKICSSGAQKKYENELIQGDRLLMSLIIKNEYFLPLVIHTGALATKAHCPEDNRQGKRLSG